MGRQLVLARSDKRFEGHGHGHNVSTTKMILGAHDNCCASKNSGCSCNWWASNGAIGSLSILSLIVFFVTILVFALPRRKRDCEKGTRKRKKTTMMYEADELLGRRLEDMDSVLM